ncbi:hypothetical protein ETH_00013740 [Eimeria tenella]|uniref:Peptidase M16 C-terminal domain-containing protein n=1 Tax=Eimeria tenella TaxID=5802 RepID=U6L4G1_EIMTE|nr:hypothetical protein ETH_00013740 [Eimeria tenella]CDJ45302.1 hypothetical protein ETH_00013740 [Eimeria tenella]|eukprot:XP_013236048.1 hypothetical protein ETH_00013740 [Eimeria tenella]
MFLFAAGVTLRLVAAHGWRPRLAIFWAAPACSSSSSSSSSSCSCSSSRAAEQQCPPSSLLLHLLEHPMPGGLMDTLIRKGLIYEGFALSHATSRSFILGLYLKLTAAGQQQSAAVLQLVRRFVLLLQQQIDAAFISSHFEGLGALSRALWGALDPLDPLQQVTAAAEATLLLPSRPDIALNTGLCLQPLQQQQQLAAVKQLLHALVNGKQVTVFLGPQGPPGGPQGPGGPQQGQQGASQGAPLAATGSPAASGGAPYEEAAVAEEGGPQEAAAAEDRGPTAAGGPPAAAGGAPGALRELPEYGVQYYVEPTEEAAAAAAATEAAATGTAAAATAADDVGDEGSSLGAPLSVPGPLACKVPEEGPVKPHPVPAVCAAAAAAATQLPSLGAFSPAAAAAAAAAAAGGPPGPCVLLADENLTILWHNGAPFGKPLVRASVRARVAAAAATAANDAFAKMFVSIFSKKIKSKLSHFHGCGVELLVAFTAGSLVFEIQASQQQQQQQQRQHSSSSSSSTAAAAAAAAAAVAAAAAAAAPAAATALSPMFEEIFKGVGEAFQQTLENITETEFEQALQELLEETQDFAASSAYELALDLSLSLLRQSRFSQFDLLQQLQQLQQQQQQQQQGGGFAAFKAFLSSSFTRTAVDCFIMGDVAAAAAKDLALQFVQQIRSSTIPYEEAAAAKTARLGGDVELVLKNPIPGDSNSVYLSLFVFEGPDVLQQLLLAAAAQLLREPFFEELRTENKDGYVAAAELLQLAPAAAIATIVQTSSRGLPPSCLLGSFALRSRK